MFEIYYGVLICISLQNVAGIIVERLDHDIISFPNCGKDFNCKSLVENSVRDGSTCRCRCASGYPTYMDPMIEHKNKTVAGCDYYGNFEGSCNAFNNPLTVSIFDSRKMDKPIIIDLSKSGSLVLTSTYTYQNCVISSAVSHPGWTKIQWTDVHKVDFSMTKTNFEEYTISWVLQNGADRSVYNGLIIKLQFSCSWSKEPCIMAKTDGIYSNEPVLPVTTTKQPQSETTTMKTTSFSKSTAKQLIKTPVIKTSLVTSGTFENTNSWPFVPSTFVTTKAPYKHPMAPSSRTGALSVPILAIIICICVLFVILVVLIVCFYQRTSRKRHSKDGAVELSVHEGSSTDSAITEPSSPIQTTIKEPETAEQPPCVSEPYYSSVNKRRKNNVKLNEPIPDEGTDDVENQIDMRNDIEASMNDERVIIEVNPIYGSLDSLTVN